MVSGYRYLLSLGLVTVLSGACNNNSDFRGAIGGSKGDKDKKDDKSVEDDEDADADEPVQVTGAFLTCAFMDSEPEVIDKAKTDPQGSVDVACGLFKQNPAGFGRIEDANLEMQVRILTNKAKLIHVAKTTRLAQGSQLQFVVPVPVEHLSGTIHVDYYERATKLYSSRRKSIPTITEFNAKYGYDVNDDESVSKYVNGEFELGRIDNDPPPPKKVEWWQIVVPIVVAAFGPQAQEPASHDNGGTVYKPCKCKNGSKTTSQSSGPKPQPTGSSSNQTGQSGQSGQTSQTGQQKPVNEEYVPVDVIEAKKKPQSQPSGPVSEPKTEEPVGNPADPGPQGPDPQPDPSPQPQPEPTPAPTSQPDPGPSTNNGAE